MMVIATSFMIVMVVLLMIESAVLLMFVKYWYRDFIVDRNDDFMNNKNGDFIVDRKRFLIFLIIRNSDLLMTIDSFPLMNEQRDFLNDRDNVSLADDLAKKEFKI